VTQGVQVSQLLAVGGVPHVATANINIEKPAMVFIVCSSLEKISVCARAHPTNEFGGQMCAVQIGKAKVVPESKEGQRLGPRRFF
jgi:hypothetical protein